jgi:hypothetical protein
MRSLQYGLGKRSPLFVDFNAGVSFNPSAYTALDCNKTPVAPPTTLTSSAAAPINTPAAFFTTGDDPNTAYSFDSQPWKLDDPANAWAVVGAFGTDGNTSLSFGPELSFGPDGNILRKPESVYDRARTQGEKAEEDLRRIQGEEAKAEAQKWAGLFEFLNKIFSTMAGAMGSPSIGGTATTAPAPAAG